MFLKQSASTRNGLDSNCVTRSQPNHTRHEWAPWDAFVSAGDPDSFAKEFASRGLTFYKELVNRNDGVRGFEVADPDGYVLFFGRPI
jgi:hypothetical protein